MCCGYPCSAWSSSRRATNTDTDVTSPAKPGSVTGISPITMPSGLPFSKAWVAGAASASAMGTLFVGTCDCEQLPSTPQIRTQLADKLLLLHMHEHVSRYGLKSSRRSWGWEQEVRGELWGLKGFYYCIMSVILRYQITGFYIMQNMCFLFLCAKTNFISQYYTKWIFLLNFFNYILPPITSDLLFSSCNLGKFKYR